MKIILEEDNIYEKMNENNVIKDTLKFQNETKKLLNNEDFSWLNLTKHQSKQSLSYG